MDLRYSSTRRCLSRKYSKNVPSVWIWDLLADFIVRDTGDKLVFLKKKPLRKGFRDHLSDWVPESATASTFDFRFMPSKDKLNFTHGDFVICARLYSPLVNMWWSKIIDSLEIADICPISSVSWLWMIWLDSTVWFSFFQQLANLGCGRQFHPLCPLVKIWNRFPQSGQGAFFAC